MAKPEPDLDAIKAEIDKLSRTQKAIGLAAIAITLAYRQKDRLESEQFVDVLKAALELAINIADYEARISILDLLSEAAPPASIPGEMGLAMFAVINRLDKQNELITTAQNRLKLMVEMVRDLGKNQ